MVCAIRLLCPARQSGSRYGESTIPMRYVSGDERRTRNGLAAPHRPTRWLLNPLRYLTMPPGRIVGRLQLSPTDRVLDIGCGPGFFSPATAHGASANAQNGSAAPR